MEIYTIGHSTHSKDEFLSLLRAYNIETLVDVRSYPGSNYMPQFNKESMEEWIPKNGMAYYHMRSLGGRRKKNDEIDHSLVNGWKNTSFQNYAAYSLTKEYEEAMVELINLGNKKTTCYMCSESVPWRCHRLIISNTLTLTGWEVKHIMTEKKTISHEISKYGAKAVKEGSTLIYPRIPEDKN